MYHRPKHGGNRRRNHDDDAYGGKHLGGLCACVAVAHHRRHDDGGHARTQTLHHAHANEPFDLGDLGDDDGRRDEYGQAYQANRFTPFQV